MAGLNFNSDASIMGGAGKPVDKRTEMLKNVKGYAKEHNINLPNPPRNNVPVGQRSKTTSDGRDRELIRLGIPAEVIAQGDKAIEKYAQEHNIKLPEKRKEWGLN